MTGSASLLVAKQHRFELGVSVAVALVVALGAAMVTARLAGIGVPLSCAGTALEAPSDSAGCVSLLQAFARIYYDDASKVLAAMAVLPIAAGLLGGVPIVGRELEAGTAQFAWALSPSRVRWLMRQLIVVGIILGVAVGLAAWGTQTLESTRRTFIPATPFENLGLYGSLGLARMVAALMVGTLVGAVSGRTLPAFIIGVLVMMGAVGLAGGARDYWGSSQPQVIVDDSASAAFDGQVVGAAWLDEAATLISYEEGVALAPAGTPDPDMWLWDHGYRQVQMGITSETAGAWAAIEGAGWIGLGLAAFVASTWVTSRRRPR